ncbi:MAG: macro domain-containing protein [Erysipelotrichaceae bacterium]
MEVLIGNIFDTKCTAIVNTVNCVGVMGKGIALEFKKRYPEMFADYVKRCKYGKLRTGEPYVFCNNDGTKIINFPTKDHWRSPSRLSYITEGLDWFVNNYQKHGITSVAFPPLGCGNGGLSWELVGPIMYQKLNKLPIEIELYAPFGTTVNEITDSFLTKTVVSDEATGKETLKINPKWYLILQTVRELNNRVYSLKVGRTIYQKICYVLTRNGVKTGFTFSKGSYGPYSLQAKESITAFANANLIIEQNLGKMISLSVSDNVVICREKFSPQEWEAMKKTVDLFGRVKSTEQAEIVATVLYSYDELKTFKSTVADKDVYNDVMAWKPHWKNSREFEVCDTIHNLAMLSLISVEYTNSLINTQII